MTKKSNNKVHIFILEVFICTAVQIILWLFAQVHCRAAFTLSSRLPLFVYTLQLTVLYVAGGDAMLTGEDEGETNTNSLVVQWRAAQLCHAPWGDRGCDQNQLPQGQRWAFVHCWLAHCCHWHPPKLFFWWCHIIPLQHSCWFMLSFTDTVHGK